MVAELNTVDEYIVSVAANNSCGLMMGDPLTVHGKKACLARHTYVCMHICIQWLNVDIYICQFCDYLICCD